jgi:hypothetical protein
MKKTIILLGIMICGSAYAQNNPAYKHVDCPCIDATYDNEHEVSALGVSIPSDTLGNAVISATRNAIIEIAMKVQSNVKNFYQSYTTGSDNDAKVKYESAVETHFETIVQDVKIVCREVTRNERGRYVVYVAARISKEKINK